MKSRMNLDSTFYDIIQGKNIDLARKECELLFPKSKGRFSYLDNEQLEILIERMKVVYETK